MKRLIGVSICLALFTVRGECSDECKEPDCSKVVVPAREDPKMTPQLIHKLGLDVLLQSQLPSVFKATTDTLANCYWLAAGGIEYKTVGGWHFSYLSAPWGRLKQEDTSALGEFRDQCTDEFYTKVGADKLITSKIDDVKAQYVDKINQLSPEVLNAIKKEVEQQVEAELLPKLLEAVKSEVAKQMRTPPTPKGATRQP